MQTSRPAAHRSGRGPRLSPPQPPSANRGPARSSPGPPPRDLCAHRLEARPSHSLHPAHRAQQARVRKLRLASAQTPPRAGPSRVASGPPLLTVGLQDWFGPALRRRWKPAQAFQAPDVAPSPTLLGVSSVSPSDTFTPTIPTHETPPHTSETRAGRAIAQKAGALADTHLTRCTGQEDPTWARTGTVLSHT